MSNQRGWLQRIVSSFGTLSPGTRLRKQAVAAKRRHIAVEGLEERLLLTADWLAGLSNNGDFIVDFESTAGSELSISQSGEVIIGPGGSSQFVVDTNGNLTIAGSFSSGSSRTIKENFEGLDSARTLELLDGLSVYGWNYLNDDDSLVHISPLAEDFYSFFGLGSDAQHLAPSDLASVVLVGIQGLSDVVSDQQAQINTLFKGLGKSGRLSVPLIVNSKGGVSSLFDPIVIARVANQLSTTSNLTTTSSTQNGATASGNSALSYASHVGVMGPWPVGSSGYIAASSNAGVTGLVPVTPSGTFVTGNQSSSSQSFVLSQDQVLAQDTVIANDAVVVGSVGIGPDAQIGQSFGTDTLRLSDDVLRIHFDDTSSTGAFPNRDWRIVINDDALRGDGHFSVEDATSGNVPFRIEAGASGNALVIDETGNIGFGTADAAANLEFVSPDSPTLRLEQTTNSQTWDLGANESSFFVRDVTSGQILPFRIVSGAPTNSLVVDSAGNVGAGTAGGAGSLNVAAADGTARIYVESASSTTAARDLLDLRNNGAGQVVFTDSSSGTTWRSGLGTGDSYEINSAVTVNPEFKLAADGTLIMGASPTSFILDAAGNLTISGSLSTPSSAALKENFESVDTQDVLNRINDLSVLLWNYIADSDNVRHVSPIAEDFYAAFGLGTDPKHISTLDIAGVAIAGVQALYDQMQFQNEQIAYLSWLVGLDYESLTDVPSPAQAGVAQSTVTLNSGATAASGASVTGWTSFGPAGTSLSTGNFTADSSPVSGASSVTSSTAATNRLSALLTLFSSLSNGNASDGELVLGESSSTADTTVQGSLGAGQNANEITSFGSDTIRLQDEVIRVHFEDTSTRPGANSNDWRIVINDAEPGGENHFSIVDAETGNTLFRIDANAPQYSMFVSALGQLGLGTTSTAANLHIAAGDTPTIRFNQSSDGGFTPSIWDVGGSETQFFVRSISNGGLVPFKIAAGAADNSLYINAAGNVGIGTASAASSVHVLRNDGTAQVRVTETSTTTAQRELLHLANAGAPSIAITNTGGPNDVTWRSGLTANDSFTFDLDSTVGTEFVISPMGQLTVGPNGASNLVVEPNGNVTIAGTINQGSSYTLKENFTAVRSSGVLQRLDVLPIFEWNYTDDGPGIRHLGPTAEDFYALFSLGADAQHVTPSDLATAALSGLQGLMDIAIHQGNQLEKVSRKLGSVWASGAVWNEPDVALPTSVNLNQVVGSRIAQDSVAAIGNFSSSTVFTSSSAPAGAVVERRLSSGVAAGQSEFVIHDMVDRDSGGSSGTEGLYLADTGTDELFVWQDQDPSTPNIVEIFFDFRDEGTYSNQITPAQVAVAQSAFQAWESAADERIKFVRNTSAPLSQIVNIGVGDLDAFGFSSSAAGTLAIGGGVVTAGAVYSITRGVVWLDFAETWDTAIGNGNIAGTFDAFTVFAHELGHALGLGHTDRVAGVDIMDGFYQGEQTNFSIVDETLIQTLYADVTLGDTIGTGDLVLSSIGQSFSGNTIFSNRMALGFDAVNNEVYGKDVLRIKENNLRIAFVDTSVGDAPGIDWQITINDNASGGASYFSIDQQTTAGASTGSSKFRVAAGAPQDSFVIDQTNRIGLGTQNPVEDIHIVAGTSPTVRLEQNSNAGYQAQSWDFGGDDGSFFVRDVTGGTSPFQVAVGADADSLLVDANGNIGIGTATPASRFHIFRGDGSAQLRVEETSAASGSRDLIVLTNNGAPLIRFSSMSATVAGPVANNPVIGVAKDANVSGDLVTFDYYLENLGSEQLTNISLPDNLDDVFGAGNYEIVSAPIVISGPGSMFVNPDFDGHLATGLLDSGILEGTDGRTGNGTPGSTLGVGETAHIRIIVNVFSLVDQGSGIGTYSSQVTASALDSTGGVVSDLSDFGTDADFNGNSNPQDAGESDPTTFSIAQNPVIGVATEITVNEVNTASINVNGTNQSGTGPRVAMTFRIENHGNVPISNITLDDDLNAVFGTGNYGTLNGGAGSNLVVFGGGSLVRNAGFNGSTQTSLITSGTLDPGAVAEITLELLLITITDQGLGLGVYEDQVSVSGQGPDTTITSDLSDAGSVADPNFNGDPTEAGEDDPNALVVGSSVGVAHTVSVTGNEATFDIYVEAFGTLNLLNVGLISELDALFGAGTYSITTVPFLVDDPGTLILNPAFDGSATNNLLDASSTLSTGDTAQLRFVVTVNELKNRGNGLGQYRSQITSLATTQFGGQLTDLSDSGTDPDPNGDDNPANPLNSEGDVTPFTIASIAVVGVAQQAAFSGNQVTIDLYLENFGSATASDLTLMDNLDGVFGAGNYTLSGAVLINDPGTLILNANFDGSSDTEILASGSTLVASDTAQIRFIVTLTKITDAIGFGKGIYRNQAVVAATDPNGVRASDFSDDNINPDANSDGDPTTSGENDATAIIAGTSSLGVALQTYVNGTQITFDYHIENLGITDLVSMTATHQMLTVFGFGNYSKVSGPTLLEGPPTLTLNSSFDGLFSPSLVSSISRLKPGERWVIRAVMNVTNVTNQGNGFGVYPTQLSVSATDSLGNTLTDLSDAGIVTDSNGNSIANDAGEDDQTVSIIGEELSVGVATTATLNGNQVTFDYYVENLGTSNLQNLSLPDYLDSIFGAGNYTIQTAPTLIDDPGTVTLNSNFDGSGDVEILDSASTLTAGDTLQIRLVLDVTNLRDVGRGFGRYEHQVVVTGFAGSSMTQDLSDDGSEPDSNGNGNPADVGENDATQFLFEAPEVGVAVNAAVSGNVVTLDYRIKNLGSVALNDVSLISDLDSVFGAGNYTLIGAPFLVSSPRNLEVNSSFDGTTRTQLISLGSMGIGATEQIRVVVRVDRHSDKGFGKGIYQHQVTVTAQDSLTNFVSDASDSGLLADSNDNGNGADAGENDPTVIVFTNTVPTGLVLTPIANSISESASVAGAITVSVISFSDDGLGTNDLSLSGADASSFEIIGNELRLKAGTVLDFETKPIYSVTVEVDDPTVGSNPDLSATFTLTLINVPDGTSGVDSFTLTYTATDVTITQSVDGGAGVVVGVFSLASPVTVTGLSANDIVEIVGTSDDDVFEVTGTSLMINGAVLILEGPATRILTGGEGDDMYRFDADDVLGYYELDETAGGNDTINFFPTTTTGITINLGSTAVQQVHPTNLSIKLRSTTMFENARGGDGNDVIIGNALNNVLRGNGGNDRLVGGRGNDNLLGGAGNDTYVFTNAASAEFDSISESLNGGSDTITFSSMSEDIMLNLGTSAIQTVHTNRTLQLNLAEAIENGVGGSGNDALRGNSLANKLYGNAGSDSLAGLGGDDALYGGLGDDTYMFGSSLGAETDSVFEGTNAGEDTLTFFSMLDSIILNIGTSAFQTVHTNRTLKLSSSSSIENAVGGAGNDVLRGNSLANSLYGNDGDDTLTGLNGDDALYGGRGDDTYVFGVASSAEADSIFEAEDAGTDTIVFSSLAEDVVLKLGTSVVQSVHNNRTLHLNSSLTIENAIGGSGNDLLLGNSLANRLEGRAGNDILVGQNGDDQLIGGDGRDLLIGGRGVDTLNGGADDDIMIAGRTTSDSLVNRLIDARTEWVSINDYQTRIANLRQAVGTSNVSLRAKFNVLNDDNDVDALTGSSGNDWYFIAVDDVIVGLLSTEILDVL